MYASLTQFRFLTFTALRILIIAAPEKSKPDYQNHPPQVWEGDCAIKINTAEATFDGADGALF